MKDNEQLYLVLKRQWFMEILDGKKNEEYREFTSFNISRFCIVNAAGKVIELKKYKSVKFQLGYTKNAPQMVVEVKDICIDVDRGVGIHNSTFLNANNCNFTIILGRILEKVNC